MRTRSQTREVAESMVVEELALRPKATASPRNAITPSLPSSRSRKRKALTMEQADVNEISSDGARAVPKAPPQKPYADNGALVLLNHLRESASPVSDADSQPMVEETPDQTLDSKVSEIQSSPTLADPSLPEDTFSSSRGRQEPQNPSLIPAAVHIPGINASSLNSRDLPKASTPQQSSFALSPKLFLSSPARNPRKVYQHIPPRTVGSYSSFRKRVMGEINRVPSRWKGQPAPFFARGTL